MVVHSRHRTDCMDGKMDVHVQIGPQHGVPGIHSMEQKGDTFPLPETKDSGISG